MELNDEYRANAEWYLAMSMRARSEIWRAQLAQVARHWQELAHTGKPAETSSEAPKQLTH